MCNTPHPPRACTCCAERQKNYVANINNKLSTISFEHKYTPNATYLLISSPASQTLQQQQHYMTHQITLLLLR